MKDFKDIKIAVAGTGYVGLSIATLLSQHHHVTAVDVIPEKVEKLNNRISPIQDEYIEKYLAEKQLNLVATLDGKAAYKDADFVVSYPKLIDGESYAEENEAIRTITDVERMKEAAKTFAALLQEGALKENIDTLFMGMKEAEAVKLFANTYLALRVSYFNELDTYAEMKGLDTKAIIDGVGLDPRIGTHYNNPS